MKPYPGDDDGMVEAQTYRMNALRAYFCGLIKRITPLITPPITLMMATAIRACVAAVLLFALALSGAMAADIQLQVTGLRTPEGNLHVALYDRPETFPKPRGMLRNLVVPVTRVIAEGLVFADLPAGEYAVALYHDENANGTLDRGLFGWPLEGFGFSQEAKVFFGPPPFDEAAFSLGSEDQKITIEPTYWQQSPSASPVGPNWR